MDADAVIRAGHPVEAGHIDDEVEFVLPVAGLDSLRRDPLDRRLVDVDEQYVVLVVDLEIPALQRQAARAEAVIPGDQLVGDLRIPDALAYLAGDDFAEIGHASCRERGCEK